MKKFKSSSGRVLVFAAIMVPCVVLGILLGETVSGVDRGKPTTRFQERCSLFGAATGGTFGMLLAIGLLVRNNET